MDELQRVERNLAYLRRLSRRAMSHGVSIEIDQLILSFERARAAITADLERGRSPLPWTIYYGDQDGDTAR